MCWTHENAKLSIPSVSLIDIRNKNFGCQCPLRSDMTSIPYTVHIYEDEATRISKWTLQYPNIETGGDLFGLWLNENEVVIQAVLGPGKNSRRTTTSFFQDEKYLSKAGSLLTHDQGLCNVGSWHSHHEMNISHGECTTCEHLPTPGRFLLLIANNETKNGATKIAMRFNLFESSDEGNEIVAMNISIVQGESPIRVDKEVSSQILEGSEDFDETKPDKEPAIKSETKKESKASRPDVTRSDKQTNKGYDDGNDFIQGQTSKPHENQRSQNKKTTCDGGYLYSHSHNTSLQHGQSFRYPRYHMKWIKLPNGREHPILYHNDHQLGDCEVCYQDKLIQRSDGEFYVKHSQSDCCTVM